MKSAWRNPTVYGWRLRLMREGLTPALRRALREALAPKILLKKPFRGYREDATNIDEPAQLKHLVSAELVLSANHVRKSLRDLDGLEWARALPILLEDFQQLLRQALDLLHELGDADNHRDLSYIDLPSITPHWQNRAFPDWVSLIELLRDAWLEVRTKDSARAARIALAWFDLPYPTFKRLALFAASHSGNIAPDVWVSWLSVDRARWLWSIHTKREALRLLVLQGQQLEATSQEQLVGAILVGPPRELYSVNLDEDQWRVAVDRLVWLRLAKLKSSGLALTQLATERLAKISTTHPDWQLANDESDEFVRWSSGTGDPSFQDNEGVENAPRKRLELSLWLDKPTPEPRPFFGDTWPDVCRTRFFHSLLALHDLAKNGVWPAGRWRVALQVWSEDALVVRSWRYTASLVQTMPDSALKEIIRAASYWMEAASKSTTCRESVMLALCQRIVLLPLDADTSSRTDRNGVETYDPVGAAINHPIGHVTLALLNLWAKQRPSDNDLIPDHIKPLFTAMCDARVDRFRHARVLLGSRLIEFFRIDRLWAEQYLLPLFSWANASEARALWEGFLWSPRLYQPLLTAIKVQFLDTAFHYSELGVHRQQYSIFLTFAALGRTEGYTADEFRTAVAALPQQGLEECAQALYQALGGAGDQREEYWKNRVQLFWQQVWPKDLDFATPQIAESLAHLSIAARGEFPAALALLRHWLRPTEFPLGIVCPLRDSGLCSQFPNDALALLKIVIADQQSASAEVSQCLDQIEQAKPELANGADLIELRQFCRTAEH